jgi:small-conductance mechanosensitive channel
MSGFVQAATVVGSALLGELVALAIILLANAVARRHARTSTIAKATAPIALVFPALGVEICLSALRLSPRVAADLGHAVGVVVIVGLAWLAARLLAVVEAGLLAHYLDPNDPAGLRTRRVQTQLRVLRRVSNVIVVVLAASVILLSFSRVRAIGASLLASAGLVGLVAGIAAKPVLGNLLAGLQIAFTQPIRLDDIVIVQGHWGRIEEITLNYVVVRIWDDRRLVVPISYFVENSFENWTHSQTELTGVVYLDVDYRTPVAEVRRALRALLEDCQDWDGRAWSLLVVGAGTETMQLRATMTARDSASTWNLRCEVRERLIDYLQRYHPDCLPRLRVSMDDSVARPDRGGEIRPLRPNEEEPLSR